VCQTKNVAYLFRHKQPPYCVSVWSASYFSPKKARENNSPFFETAFRRRPIGSYMSLPYFQPYGPPVIAMFFFDEFSG